MFLSDPSRIGHGDRRIVSQAAKRPVPEADHSHDSSAEAENSVAVFAYILLVLVITATTLAYSLLAD
jgi:hypothetical protein